MKWHDDDDDDDLQIVKTQRFTIKKISVSTFQHGLSIIKWILRTVVDTQMKKKHEAEVLNKRRNMKETKAISLVQNIM